MKAFTSLPEYVPRFAFPLDAFLEHRREEQQKAVFVFKSCIFILELLTQGS